MHKNVVQTQSNRSISTRRTFKQANCILSKTNVMLRDDDKFSLSTLGYMGSKSEKIRKNCNPVKVSFEPTANKKLPLKEQPHPTAYHPYHQVKKTTK